MLLYAPVGGLLSSVDPALAVLGGIATLGLARLPDYDRRVPFVGHRGVTHTLPFLVFVAGAVGWLGWLFANALGTDRVLTVGLGVAVAVIAVGSHLLADCLTPSGVPLLWPLSRRRYTVALTRATDPLANGGLFAVGVAASILAGYVGGVI